MPWLLSIAAAITLLLSSNSSGDAASVVRLRTAVARVEFPDGARLPVLPDMEPTPEQDAQKPATHPAIPPGDPAPKPRSETLQPESRLALIRFVDGEFARVLAPIPAGKKGFHIKAGVPVDEKQLRMALGSI